MGAIVLSSIPAADDTPCLVGMPLSAPSMYPPSSGRSHNPAATVSSVICSNSIESCPTPTVLEGNYAMNLIGKRKEMARIVKREDKLARKRAKLKPAMAEKVETDKPTG